MRFIRRMLGWIVACAAIGAAIVLVCNLVVLSSTRSHRFNTVADVPARPVALVLGAGLNADGTPSEMLADRLDAGAALLRAGKVQALLFSGDNGAVEYNELASMKTYALAHGVPANRIVLDFAGFDTYDSCYRAREIFGVQAAIVVTQDFHLPRAVYLCRKLGIDAVGLAQPDWGKYGNDLMIRLAIRESAARVRALLDSAIHRTPEILGSPEPSVKSAAFVN